MGYKNSYYYCYYCYFTREELSVVACRRKGWLFTILIDELKLIIAYSVDPNK